MDSLLPQDHGRRHGVGGGVAATPGSAPPLHDHVDGAPHADKQHGEPTQPPSAVRKYSERHGVGVVVSDVHHVVDPQTTMRGDGLVHGAVQDHNEALQVGAFTTRAQSDAGLVALRRHRLEPINPQVHPHAIERDLNGGDEDGLP